MENVSMQEMRNKAREVSERVQRGTGSALSRMHDTLSPNTEVNVSDMERVLSAVAGSALLAGGLSRGSLFGALMAVGGGALIHRGMTGHCAVYGRLGKNTAMPQLGSERWGGARIAGHAGEMPYDTQGMRRESMISDDTIASAASGA